MDDRKGNIKRILFLFHDDSFAADSLIPEFQGFQPAARAVFDGSLYRCLVVGHDNHRPVPIERDVDVQRGIAPMAVMLDGILHEPLKRQRRDERIVTDTKRSVLPSHSLSLPMIRSFDGFENYSATNITLYSYLVK